MGESKTSPPYLFSFIFSLFLTVACLFTPLGAQQQSPIKTIVVLVMENRFFDHMLRWMKQYVNPSINGVTGDECNPISTKNPNQESICFIDDTEFVDLDSGHSFEAVEQQVFGSSNIPSVSGFVDQA
ncbi:hypothetical protein CXB51_018323 [Gossypium anomalum]|uniref:Phosphoesterase n=1 Tax=Gossypium anomalum TaxID=47600 RepID=A0A8J6CXL1_9ROSI|nr:hypothetical protein CXB51_018323 [Gossypium anomalum]